MVYHVISCYILCIYTHVSLVKMPQPFQQTFTDRTWASCWAVCCRAAALVWLLLEDTRWLPWWWEYPISVISPSNIPINISSRSNIHDITRIPQKWGYQTEVFNVLKYLNSDSDTWLQKCNSNVNRKFEWGYPKKKSLPIASINHLGGFCPCQDLILCTKLNMSPRCTKIEPPQGLMSKSLEQEWSISSICRVERQIFSGWIHSPTLQVIYSSLWLFNLPWEMAHL